MIELLAILLVTYGVVGWTCYEAGADAQKRAEWTAHTDEAIAVANSAARHPSRRP